MFERLNEIEDDRSFVILATSILENQIDSFLIAFIPNHKILINNRTNLNSKINYLKAFNLIPLHFPQMIDCLKNLRNEFAHNLNIDNFNDIDKSNILKSYIEQMKVFWKKFHDDMCYWSENKNIRFLFKDICFVCIEGLRIYESNVRIYRKVIENKIFISELDK